MLGLRPTSDRKSTVWSRNECAASVNVGVAGGAHAASSAPRTSGNDQSFRVTAPNPTGSALDACRLLGRRALHAEDLGQEPAGVAGGMGRDLLRWAGHEDLAAGVSSLRSQVDDPVRGLDH